MKWFHGIDNIEDLKAEYRKLAMKNHPDRGGDTATMQKINEEYARLFDRLKDIHKSTRPDGPKTYTSENKTTETPEDFIKIINALFRFDGLEIELCGRWLWISGETLRHKEALKALGCKWSKSKRAWSWHFPEDSAFSYKGRREWSMGKIRAMWGSEMIEREDGPERAAIPA